jgi:hypothetical protein
VGQLTVQGEDRTDVEITTTRSTKHWIDAKDRETMTQKLAQVKVTTQRKGEELTILTALPKHPRLLRPFTGNSDFAMDYLIKVPRSVRLVIEHDGGQVNVIEVQGDIRASDREGQVLLRLSQNASIDVDAKCTVGAVQSDFAGHERRRRFFGHTFLRENASGSQKLFLRQGYGDITILKIRQP